MAHLSRIECSHPDVYDWYIDTVASLDEIPESDDLDWILSECERLDIDIDDLSVRDILEDRGYRFLGRENTYNFETYLGNPLIESLFETPGGDYLSLIHAQERDGDVRNWSTYGRMRVYRWEYEEDRYETLPQFKTIQFWDNGPMEVVSRDEAQDRADQSENVSADARGLILGKGRILSPEVSF